MKTGESNSSLFLLFIHDGIHDRNDVHLHDDDTHNVPQDHPAIFQSGNLP